MWRFREWILNLKMLIKQFLIIGQLPLLSLIGGRVEMLESSDCAIKREVKEELGEEVEINKTLWIVENFFEYEKKNYHEISTIYLVRLPKESDIINKNKSFYRHEGN